jgi:hypothetical protein
MYAAAKLSNESHAPCCACALGLWKHHTFCSSTSPSGSIPESVISSARAERSQIERSYFSGHPFLTSFLVSFSNACCMLLCTTDLFILCGTLTMSLTLTDCIISQYHLTACNIIVRGHGEESRGSLTLQKFGIDCPQHPSTFTVCSTWAILR